MLCSSSGLCVSSIKTGTRRIMRPDELPFVVRRSRRISKESSSRDLRSQEEAGGEHWSVHD